jgi:cytoskeletal protein CcmA (bactofilin family)
MFDKNPKPFTDLLGKTNRIVEGTTINGDIFSPADFRMDGELVGNFTSKGKLVIGPAGSIKGDIVCVNVDIEGKFEGKINAEDTLNIKQTAIIIGETIVSKLSVEPGAIFNATCIMSSNSSKSIQSDNQ